MNTIRITLWIARVLGALTALLGWLFLLGESSTTTSIARMLGGAGTQLLGWLRLITQSSSFILTHMVLGITFAFLFLVVSLIQLLTGRMRLLGATGIAYTLILTALGFTQAGLLQGSMHWLIQSAHVVIGLGALVLVQVISARDARLRRAESTVLLAQTRMRHAVR